MTSTQPDDTQTLFATPSFWYLKSKAFDILIFSKMMSMHFKQELNVNLMRNLMASEWQLDATVMYSRVMLKDP